MTRVSADRIACDRSGRRVVADVSFTLADGQYLELRGANGTGKSTLLRALAGLGEISAGRLDISGTVHYLGHLDAIKPALTVQENLAFWRDFWGDGDVEAALAAFAMTQLADVPASYLSEGQKRRLALSRLVLSKREIWFLDEPNAGLDDASLARLEQLMRLHLEAGGVIIAALHAGVALAPSQSLVLGERA
jgi:heme exporter protein A